MKNFLIDMMMAVKQSPSSIFLENIYQSQRHIDLWISLHDSDSGWVGLTKDPSTEGGPRSVGVVLLLLMLEPMECFKSFHSQCQWRW